MSPKISFPQLLQNVPAFSGQLIKEEADTSIKPFFCTKPAISGPFKGFFLLQAQLSDVVVKLRRVFQIGALAEWSFCYEQSVILH